MSFSSSPLCDQASGEEALQSRSIKFALGVGRAAKMLLCHSFGVLHLILVILVEKISHLSVLLWSTGPKHPFIST